jgi:hypothetical protein
LALKIIQDGGSEPMLTAPDTVAPFSSHATTMPLAELYQRMSDLPSLL